MDSRKEVIEKLEEARSRAEGVHGYSAIDKINEALSILTSKPAPCEDAEGVAEAIEQDLCGLEGEPGHESVIVDIPEAGKLIAAYATRCEQEAREDERRKTMHNINCSVRHEIKELDKIGVIDGKTTVLARISAAILQGTEPAGDEWVEHVICEGSRFHVLWWDTHGEHCSEPKCIINKPKAEPAKVSEDTERDIDMLRDAINASQYCASDAKERMEWDEALDRLVSRIKEGNRG